MSSKTSRNGERKSHNFFKSITNLCSSESKPNPLSHCTSHFISLLKMVNLNLHRLCSRLQPTRRRPKIRVVLHRNGDLKTTNGSPKTNQAASITTESSRTIRIATFNAAMFTMAPAVSLREHSSAVEFDIRCKSENDRPKSILKQQSMSKSKRRVSINLPDNEISVGRSKQLNSFKEGDEGLIGVEKGKAPMHHRNGIPAALYEDREPESLRSNRSVLDVLREAGADIIALQNVKAEEEKGMKPLSDLAEGLGMKYVFADSWAPEFGNAILSRWPIKQWIVHKIFDNTDFRNVLKATIEVPRAGLVNIHCTHLDHLDENWRMKQINSIIQSSDGPHILAGGLNSLDQTDYSAERWSDIVKYYEEIGKPTPKVEVMNFLKGKQYVDAKNFAGECEAVVVIAKGQDVQGTCKYGTRVDYILASPNSPYKFMPGSYGVVSSKGTSDHHIVMVDIMIDGVKENDSQRQPKQRVVKIDKSSPKGIWRTD